MHRSKILVYVTLFLFTAFPVFCCSGQTPTHLPLSKKIKDSLKKEIDVMVVNDQKYRWMIQFDELDAHRLDSFRKLDEHAKFKRMSSVAKDKSPATLHTRDSLSSLQYMLDSVNFAKIYNVIYKYGYPKKYVESYKISVILNHNANFVTDDFLRLLLQEVKNGNMPAGEYANMYDAQQTVWKRPKLYYGAAEYDAATNTFNDEKPNNLDATNKARQELGLKKIKG